jgi:ABC-type multidrug transport system fused ATPase/permease subunit
MNLYIRILNYVKPYKNILAAALVCTVLAAGGNLYLPWIIKDMVDKVLSEKDSMMLNLIAVQYRGHLHCQRYFLLRSKLLDELCGPTCSY